MPENNQQENSNCPQEEIGPLRTEIVESQKARIDLLKYKLVAIATLAAIGLGFNTNQAGSFLLDSDYVLTIIPFVCLYVDLLCWHNTLRILVIGRFLDYHDDPYENYLPKIGKVKRPKKPTDFPTCDPGYFFELEDRALNWSTILVSSLLFLYGCSFFFNTNLNWLKGSIFALTGFAGIIFTIRSKKAYEKRCDLLFENADKLKQDKPGDPAANPNQENSHESDNKQ